MPEGSLGGRLSTLDVGSSHVVVDPAAVRRGPGGEQPLATRASPCRPESPAGERGWTPWPARHDAAVGRGPTDAGHPASLVERRSGHRPASWSASDPVFSRVGGSQIGSSRRQDTDEDLGPPKETLMLKSTTARTGYGRPHPRGRPGHGPGTGRRQRGTRTEGAGGHEVADLARPGLELHRHLDRQAGPYRHREGLDRAEEVLERQRHTHGALSRDDHACREPAAPCRTRGPWT